MSYLPNRKRVDENIIIWEKSHDMNTQTQSLPMFCVNEYAKDLMQQLLEKGFDPQKAKDTLKRLMSNPPDAPVD